MFLLSDNNKFQEEGTMALSKAIVQYFTQRNIWKYVNLDIIEVDPYISNAINSYLKSEGFEKIEENERVKIDKSYYLMIGNMIRMNKEILSLTLG